jgi:hypothetical protein
MPGIVCLASGLAMEGARLTVFRFLPDQALMICLIALGIGFLVAALAVYIIYPGAYSDLRRLVHLAPDPPITPIVLQD